MKKNIFCYVFFILFMLTYSSIAKSQSCQQDKFLIFKTKQLDNNYYEVKKITFFENKNKSALTKYNPISLVFKSTMFIYQSFFSKQLFSSCIYSPSCSEMSKQLIREFGLFKGVFLSADRISRCTPSSFFDRDQSCINIHDGKIYESVSIYKRH